MLPVSVAAKVGVRPEIGLFEESRSVMVTVEVDDPLATTGPVPVIEQLAASAVDAMKVTDVVTEDRKSVV